MDPSLDRERLLLQARVAAAAERSRVSRETHRWHEHNRQAALARLPPQAEVEFRLVAPGAAPVTRRVSLPAYALPWVAQRFDVFLEDLRQDCRGAAPA